MVTAAGLVEGVGLRVWGKEGKSRDEWFWCWFCCKNWKHLQEGRKFSTAENKWPHFRKLEVVRKGNFFTQNKIFSLLKEEKKKQQNTTINKQHIHKKTLRLLSSQRESVSLWLEEKGQWEGLPQISPKLKDCGGGLEGVEDCVTSGDTFVQSALAFPSWRICFWKKG